MDAGCSQTLDSLQIQDFHAAAEQMEVKRQQSIRAEHLVSPAHPCAAPGFPRLWIALQVGHEASQAFLSEELSLADIEADHALAREPGGAPDGSVPEAPPPWIACQICELDACPPHRRRPLSEPLIRSARERIGRRMVEWRRLVHASFTAASFDLNAAGMNL
jgi:hypothetical protein